MNIAKKKNICFDSDLHRYWTLIESPLGELLLTSTGESLTGLSIRPTMAEKKELCQGEQLERVFSATKKQLHEYFLNKRKSFDLPLTLRGTEFQTKVWRALQNIPHGKTISYRTLAEKVGKPSASRAVGNANGKNPVPIIVPCHRVVAHDGGIGGYTGGLDKKRLLLDLESGA